MVVLGTQGPPGPRTRPGPHPSRTLMTVSSGCRTETGGMACADDAKASAKATAINLIITFLPVCGAAFLQRLPDDPRCIQFHQTGTHFSGSCTIVLPLLVLPSLLHRHGDNRARWRGRHARYPRRLRRAGSRATRASTTGALRIRRR